MGFKNLRENLFFNYFKLKNKLNDEELNIIMLANNIIIGIIKKDDEKINKNLRKLEKTLK